MEIAQTVATQPRQLHYSNNLSKKKGDIFLMCFITEMYLSFKIFFFLNLQKEAVWFEVRETKFFSFFVLVLSGGSITCGEAVSASADER